MINSTLAFVIPEHLLTLVGWCLGQFGRMIVCDQHDLFQSFQVQQIVVLVSHFHLLAT